MPFSSRHLTPLFLFLLLTSPFLLMAEVISNQYWLLQQAFLLTLLLVFFTFSQKSTLKAPPLIAFLAVGFVVFLFVQMQFIQPIFIGGIYTVMAVFVLAAMLVWAIRYWTDAHGNETLILVLAWGLFIGSILQSAVVIIQFFSLPVPFIIPTEWHSATGQMGQRNQLGHYLMWGVIAWGYLWHRHHISKLLGFSILLMLSAILGLVASRTIFAYVLVLALLLLVRWLSGSRQKNRLIIILFTTIIVVSVCQWLTPVILSLFDIGYQSAIERLSSTSDQARWSEWHKAWLLFIKSPLIGQGWSNYASQSYLLPEADYFRPYGLEVLFTHSHNIILQLLAETGIVGTFILALAVLIPLWNLLRYRSDHALFLILLILVSLTHSLLEHPLWYPYFFFPFVAFLALAPQAKSSKLAKTLPNWTRIIVLLLCVMIAGRFWLVNQSYPIVWFTAHMHMEENQQQKYQNAQVLYEMSELEPFLSEEAARGLPFKIAADNDILPDVKTLQLAEKGILHSPYHYNAFARALYLYRLDRKDEADAWIAATVRYYPQTLPYMVETAGKSTHFNELTNDLLAACNAYRQSHPEIGSCLPEEIR